MLLTTTVLLSALILAAQAAPLNPLASVTDVVNGLDINTLDTENTLNELENGPCRGVTFIYARGSTEPGNMGLQAGTQTCSQLKSRFNGDVACQGVGPPYQASLVANTFERGTAPQAINEASRLFQLAATKCPRTTIVGGGYSQGAAVMAGSLTDISTQTPAVANRIAGVVLYGYTRNLQNAGRIPGFPRDKTLVICNEGDLVCQGTLIIAPPHLAYGPTVPKAVQFLASRVSQQQQQRS